MNFPTFLNHPHPQHLVIASHDLNSGSRQKQSNCLTADCKSQIQTYPPKKETQKKRAIQFPDEIVARSILISNTGFKAVKLKAVVAHGTATRRYSHTRHA